MLKKIWLNFIFIIFISGNNLPLISSLNNEDVNQNSNLTIDYLKKIPANDYILGSGDELAITISRDVSGLDKGRFVIDGEGTIILPRIKRIFVKGLTVNELIILLNESFKKYLKYPNVEVVVSEYRPINVFVEGEVETPGLQTLKGAFTLKDSVPEPIIKFEDQRKVSFSNFSNRPGRLSFFPTVFDAIRQSGGVTEYSNLSNIQVIRKNKISDGGGKITTKLNLKELIYSGKNNQNIRIYDGDIIRVSKLNVPNSNTLGKAIFSNLNPRFVEVFVAGRVNFPGYIRLSRAGVLTDAVDMAGGAKVLKGPLTFIRFNNDGSVDKRKFRYRKNVKRGSFKNPTLNNGDLIIVGESAFSVISQVTREFTAPFVGIYSTYSLFDEILN